MLWIALRAQAAPELHPAHIRRCGEPPEDLTLYRAEVTLGDLGLPAGEGVDETLPVSVISEQPRLSEETWALIAEGAARDLGYRVRRGEIRARRGHKGRDLSGVSILARADGLVERFPAERSLAPYAALVAPQQAPAPDAHAPLPSDVFARATGSEIDLVVYMTRAFSWSSRLPDLCDALAASTGRLLLLDASAEMRWTFSSTGPVSATQMLEILGALLPTAGLSLRQDDALSLIAPGEGTRAPGEEHFLVALFSSDARLDEALPEGVREGYVEVAGGLLKAYDLSQGPVGLQPGRREPDRFGAWPVPVSATVSAADRCLTAIEGLRAVPRKGPSGAYDGLRLVLKPGSLYERVGLQNGDVLYLVDGTAVGEAPEAGIERVKQAIASPGQHILLVERRSEPLEIAFDVKEGPPCKP